MRRTRTIVIIPVLLLSFLWQHEGKSQKLVHVVKKAVVKQLPYQAGDTLKIYGEKAIIEVAVGNPEKIGITMELISKHPDRAVAETEVEYLKYEIDERPGTHILRNYFLADNSFKKVKGNLLVHYKLTIPASCPLVVQNQYGKLEVKGLKASVDVQLKFVEFELNQVSGSMSIESLFGKNSIRESQGTILGNFQKSDLEVSDFNGAIAVACIYGKVFIANSRLSSLHVEGSRTSVELTLTDVLSYNYDLKTSSAVIELPGILEFGEDNTIFNKQIKKEYPTLTIHTTFSPIKINLK